MKMGKHSDVESALTSWFVLTRTHNIPVSNGLLKRKAKAFARKMGNEGFTPSSQWLKFWKQSNAIISQTPGDQISKTKSNNGDTKVDQDRLTKLFKDYKPNDIYALKEIGIKCNVLTQEVLRKVKGENFDDKVQLTILFATDQCGLDKRPLVVIGEQALTSAPSSLPCDYHTELHAWMTSDIFVDWLIEFDYDMRKQKRQIVLVLDSSPVHPKEVQKDLANIKLVFVDPDHRTKQNPCDYGISYSLKALYRREFTVRQILEGERVMSQLDVFHMLNKAWFLLSSKTITAGFYKAGIHDEFETPPDAGQEEITIEDLSTEDVVKYVEFDKGLRCCGMPSSDNICSKVLGQTVFESKDELLSWSDDEAVGVTEDDALRVLATLRRFYETNEMIDFSSFYALETQVLESINRKDL